MPATQNNIPRFVNSALPYDAYLEFYLQGKFKSFKGRKVLRIGNLFIPWSRVYWSLLNPNETLLPEEDIHHRDLDKTNDQSDNLERRPHRPHMREHREIFKRDPSYLLDKELRAEYQEAEQSNFSRIPRTFRKWFEQRATNQ